MADSKKTKEVMKFVSHQQASQLLHNKFAVVLGDSIQRAVYKDLVLLLQKGKYLTRQQLKTKGEMSFEMDCLIEGGCLNHMHNGTEYREVRQYQSPHHLVRFYFATRIYSQYMQSILEDFRKGPKPDVVIVNSCVWDISRYSSMWVNDYKKNLFRFFEELSGILPEETLVIWSLTMPLAENIRGGFLVPEIEHKAPHLRADVIEANFFSASLADSYGMDVLDFHFHFRFSHQHRTKDGVHWNALAHRRITSLLLQHAAEAWAVNMPCALTTVEHSDAPVTKPVRGNASKPARKKPGVRRVQFVPYYHHPPPTNYFPCEERYDNSEFYSNFLPCNYDHFEVGPPPYHWDGGPNRSHRLALPAEPYQPVHRRKYNQYGHGGNGFHFQPWHHHGPYNEYQHQYTMRIRHSRPHYAPYTHYRPHPSVGHWSYY